MSALRITGLSLRRLARDRAALFFMVALPVLVIPSSFGREVAASGPVEVGVVAERANSTQRAAATAVQAAVSQFSARVAAARFTTARLGGDFAANLALAQAALIVLVGAAAFGVSWGGPLAATLLVLVWSLVGAGAGVLAGTLYRTPQQAGARGPTIGIAFGMLGGCMRPLPIASHAMRTVGHLTPQAWAVDAWTTLLARHGTLPDVTTVLGVLAAFAAFAAFAAGSLALAAARFRRSLA